MLHPFYEVVLRQGVSDCLLRYYHLTTHLGLVLIEYFFQS